MDLAKSVYKFIVQHYQITWDELLERMYTVVFAGKEISAEVKKTMSEVNRYKVNDYKLFMAHIFPELFQDYDWWGMMDNDSLVGNLSKFFPRSYLDQWDIISGGKLRVPV